MQEFTCTTWNILAPEFVECHYYGSIACPRLDIDIRRRDIYKTIEGINSDVFILQEVTKDEFIRLENHFGKKYKMKLALHDAKHWEITDEKGRRQRNGNAIMARKGSIKIKRLKRLKLHENGNYALVANIKVNGVPATVCTVHLDATNSKTRMVQLRTLLKYVKKDNPLIIGGDFNEPTTKISSYMNKKKFSSTPVDTPTYFEEKDMTIDFLFTRGATYSHSYVPHSTRTTIIREFGSDHLPVTAHIDLPILKKGKK